MPHRHTDITESTKEREKKKLLVNNTTLFESTIRTISSFSWYNEKKKEVKWEKLNNWMHKNGKRTHYCYSLETKFKCMMPQKNHFIFLLERRNCSISYINYSVWCNAGAFFCACLLTFLTSCFSIVDYIAVMPLIAHYFISPEIFKPPKGLSQQPTIITFVFVCIWSVFASCTYASYSLITLPFISNITIQSEFLLVLKSIFHFPFLLTPNKERIEFWYCAFFHMKNKHPTTHPPIPASIVFTHFIYECVKNNFLSFVCSSFLFFAVMYMMMIIKIQKNPFIWIWMKI